MRCVRNKWGAGTTCEKVPETSATKEINSRLATMVAEREQQDKMWVSASPSQEKEITTKSEFFIKSQNLSVTRKDG
jgi:hypothetical protein